MIAAIVARDKNGVIGTEGDLPWYLPADLAHFKKVTLGGSVIMGRKTYESVSQKAGGPLPGRRNIVITHTPSWHPGGDVTVVRSVDDAMHVVSESETDSFVIGGQSIYEQMLPYVSKLYVTEIDAEFEGDRYFPVQDMDEWHEVSRETHYEDERNHYNYSFVVYERNSAADF